MRLTSAHSSGKSRFIVNPSGLLASSVARDNGDLLGDFGPEELFSFSFPLLEEVVSSFRTESFFRLLQVRFSPSTTGGRRDVCMACDVVSGRSKEKMQSVRLGNVTSWFEVIKDDQRTKEQSPPQACRFSLRDVREGEYVTCRS